MKFYILQFRLAASNACKRKSLHSTVFLERFGDFFLQGLFLRLRASVRDTDRKRVYVYMFALKGMHVITCMPHTLRACRDRISF